MSGNEDFHSERIQKAEGMSHWNLTKFNTEQYTQNGRALHISMDWEVTGCLTAFQRRTGEFEYALAGYP